MRIELPVIEIWTNAMGNFSDQALIMLIDVIPLPICWTFNEHNMMNLDLNITRVSSAKFGEILTIDLSCHEIENKKIVTIHVEVRVGTRLIATASSGVKFIKNTNWRVDKL
jgi:acyl-coenzyme A thioesterase PaaI-like protein